MSTNFIATAFATACFLDSPGITLPAFAIAGRIEIFPVAVRFVLDGLAEAPLLQR